jgi:hypothetical protein
MLDMLIGAGIGFGAGVVVAVVSPKVFDWVRGLVNRGKALADRDDGKQ